MAAFRPLPFRPSSLPEPSSLSLRWRVMLLAMSMVAMVVVLMALAVYVVVSQGALRRHRQPTAQPGPAADRKRFAGRRSRQGHRGHRLLRRQRDAGEPGPVHLHRQPAGPDAAHRQAGEGRDVRPAAAVAAHRRPSARAGRASEQRQLVVDLQEPGPDRQGAQTAWAPCCSSSAVSGWRSPRSRAAWWPVRD